MQGVRKAARRDAGEPRRARQHDSRAGRLRHNGNSAGNRFGPLALPEFQSHANRAPPNPVAPQNCIKWDIHDHRR